MSKRSWLKWCKVTSQSLHKNRQQTTVSYWPFGAEHVGRTLVSDSEVSFWDKPEKATRDRNDIKSRGRWPEHKTFQNNTDYIPQNKRKPHSEQTQTQLTSFTAAKLESLWVGTFFSPLNRKNTTYKLEYKIITLDKFTDLKSDHRIKNKLAD